jgi:hypothetical protein
MEKRRTLREVLPSEFKLEFMYVDSCNPASANKLTPAAKLLDVEVVKEYFGDTFKRWPGTQKNVHCWWELANGKAVGWNENTAGWSFPVVKL